MGERGFKKLWRRRAVRERDLVGQPIGITFYWGDFNGLTSPNGECPMAKKAENNTESKSEPKKQNNEPIKQGDKVAVHYIGRTDGVVFDSSRNMDPIEFVVGSGELIKGFDTAVIGMKVGDKKTIKIPPEQAYGAHEPKMVVTVPRQTMKLDAELKPGMRVEMTLPDGNHRILTIVKVEGDALTIDLNHPLAGKTLEFELEIMSVGN